ncbi:hypothetical protein Tco_1205925 [Tanacetum coccineum]
MGVVVVAIDGDGCGLVGQILWSDKMWTRTYEMRVVPLFLLSLADVDPHFMMEDESLLWTSNDVVILLQHGSEKIPLRIFCDDIFYSIGAALSKCNSEYDFYGRSSFHSYVSETEITCFSVPSAAIYSGYLAG